MGEELKSPFIDSISSMQDKKFQENSEIQVSLKDNKETISVKECFKRISAKFKFLLPTHKKIPHGILDAVYFRGMDTIIALCYENRMLSFNLLTEEIIEVDLAVEIMSLCGSTSELFVAALGKNEILILDPTSLQISKQISFTNPRLGCPYASNDILIATDTEIYILNSHTSSIKNTQIMLNDVKSIEFKEIKDLFVCSDADGIKTYNSHFQLKNYYEALNITLVKFSELSENIIAVDYTQILILSKELEVCRTIYTFTSIFDVIFQEKDEFLLCCSLQGEVLIYDLRTERRKIKIPVHYSQLAKVFLRDKKIIAVGGDSRISTIRFPKLHSLVINKVSSQSIATTDNHSSLIYIHDSSDIKFWNFKENFTTVLLRSSNLSQCLLVYKNKIYASNASTLYEIDSGGILRMQTADKSSEVDFTSMEVCRGVLACAGNSQVIYLWSTEQLKEHSQLYGHEGSITCLGKFRQYLFSGSTDRTVRVWNFKKMTLAHVLNYHTMKVTCVIGDNGKVISSSDDRTIKICYIKTGDLIFSLENIIGSVRSLAAFDGEFLISCGSTGKIMYWNLKTYSEMLVTNTNMNLVTLVANNSFLAYTNGKAIHIMRNPLFYDKVSVFGPDEMMKYEFMIYSSAFLNSGSPDYSEIMDKWIITPYFITPMHLYAYFNFTDQLTCALNSGEPLIQSRIEQNPLSLAVTRDLEGCVECILKSLRVRLQKNPYAICFMNNKSLIEMNQTSHVSLTKFYSLIFREVNSEKLPSFIRYNTRLPIYGHSYNMVPPYHIFFDEKYIKDNGEAVVFTRSVIKLNLELGSRESIDLLRSIRDCQNLEIFGTSFVMVYMRDKWERVKWFSWIQFVIYFSYLIFICVYMLHFYDNKLFLMLPLSINILLMVYEIYKALVSKIEYLLDPWNYVDLARALLFFIYAFRHIVTGSAPEVHGQSHEVQDIDNLLLVVTLLSFIRGISYFRIFELTRHWTFLIYVVILEGRAFTIMLFYSMVAVAFLFYIVFRFEGDYSDYLAYAFFSSIDYLDPTYFNKTQWTVYAFSLTVNYLMMMNVLISIYYYAYWNVVAGSEIADCRTLAALSLEAERNMFWKRNASKNHYLCICEKEYVQGDDDPMLAKMKEIKRSVKDMQGQISQFLEAKKDIEKINKINEKIFRILPKK